MASSTGLPAGVPNGYPTEIFDSPVNVKYKCWQCKMVLKHPMQSQCGHRICKECMLHLIRNNQDAQVLCQACVEDEDGLDPSYLIEKETFPDAAIKREMSNLKVKCSFSSCPWNGNFKEYETHYDNCEFLPVNCEVCGIVVAKNELQQHVDDVHASTGVRTCPGGCETQVDVANIQSHLLDNLASHFGAVIKRIAVIERLVTAGDGNVAGRITAIESQQKLLNEKFRQHPSTQGAAASGASNAELAATGDLNSSVADKLVVYEGVLTVLSRELEIISGKVEKADREKQLDREMIDSFDRKIRALERTLTMKDATISELELRVDALETTSYDGTLVWRITDFARVRQDAVSGRTTSVYSPPFYTSRTGYKMCARLYLNGDGLGKGTHVSLFFVVMRGAYDALLKWPFRQKVTLMFLDQNGREHVVDAFRPDTTSSSFKRPTTDMNIASGCPMLMPLSNLDSTTHAYVKDNTAYIKIIVNTDD